MPNQPSRRSLIFVFFPGELTGEFRRFYVTIDMSNGVNKKKKKITSAEKKNIHDNQSMNIVHHIYELKSSKRSLTKKILLIEADIGKKIDKRFIEIRKEKTILVNTNQEGLMQRKRKYVKQLVQEDGVTTLDVYVPKDLNFHEGLHLLENIIQV